MQTDHGTDQDDVIRRLHSLGTEPVEPSLASRHLTFLAAAGPVTAGRRRSPLVVGALLAGLVMGGTGLAAALPGSLPGQASSVARSALEAVNLVDGKQSTPEAKAAKAAAKAAKEAAKAADTSDSNLKVGRFLTGCTTGTPPVPFTGTHGQYVKAHPDNSATADVNEREVAAKSDCGKPLSSIGTHDAADATKDKDDDATEVDHEGSGKPADAGRPESPGKSEEEHPPSTATKEQGSENRATDPGKSDDAGKSDEHRPEGVGSGS